MKKILILLSCALFLGSHAPQLSAQAAPADNPGAEAPNNVRHWTDKQGRVLRMQFLRLEGNNAVMRTPDRRIQKFPLTSLAAADQEIARQMTPLSTARSGAAPGDHRQSASMIDQLVEVKLKENNRVPNERTTDEQFVRRIYLDAIGRTPTYEETVSFLNDPEPAKRSNLIDKLLASEGYTSHMFNYMADVLRLRDRLSENVNYLPGQPYTKWVKDSIAAGKPYNEMVYEMLTATGKVWNNPAAGYLLMDSGMANDNMANTLSIFLGTEIACAQCHDHPFYKEEWTRKKFFQMAAFYGNTSTQRSPRSFERNPSMIEGEVKDVAKGAGMKVMADGEPTREWSRLEQQLGNMITANRYDITEREENMTKLPHDYQYGDGKPGDAVDPKFLTWSNIRKSDHVQVSIKKAENPRTAFATWLTHEDNPMFSKVIANRLWKRAFGVGVAEPIDNLFDPETVSSEKLLDFLSSEMKRVNFDLREFQRILFNSKTYQRQVAEEPYEPGTAFLFAGPALRRLNAEQIWDSYLALVMESPEAPKGNDGSVVARSLDMDLDSVDGKTAALKLNGYVNRNKNTMMMMNASMEGGVKKRNGMTLMRASELSQPAPAGHFIREFGQSDRSVFDNSSHEGTVPQILMMLNGGATQMLTDRNSLIFEKMDAKETAEEKVDVVFLSIFNRLPTPREKDIAMKEIEKNSTSGYANLVYSLINTREFLFVQ